MPTVTILAHADAYVDEALPDSNFGDETVLRVRTELDANRRAYVEFDMDQVPDDFVEWRDPVSIYVQLVRTDNPSLENRRIDLEDLAASFDELGLTWNTQPALGEGLIEYDEPTGEFLHFDLLGVLQVIPLSGPWPLRMRDSQEDDDSLEGPFEQELATREHSSIEAAKFEALYQAQRHGDLTASLTVQRASHTDVDTAVQPRVQGQADLAAVLDVVYVRDLRVTVAPTVQPLDDGARVEGVIAHRFLEPLDDVRRIAEEAGTRVERTRDGDVKALHRIVHLVDSSIGRSFPRERTSGPRERTRLRRGDAVLYALEGDTWRPGEVVTWQARDWVVAGVLSEERLEERVLYREVGLRRLSLTARGRVAGVIA